MGHKIIGTVSESAAWEEYERLGGDSEKKHVGDKHLRQTSVRVHSTIAIRRAAIFMDCQ